MEVCKRFSVLLKKDKGKREAPSEFRSCVKVEVALLGFLT